MLRIFRVCPRSTWLDCFCAHFIGLTLALASASWAADPPQSSQVLAQVQTQQRLLATATVPDLYGLRFSDVLPRLQQAGLRLGHITNPDPDGNGWVVDQSPPAGRRVLPASQVAITLSSTPPPPRLTQTPNLIGATVQEAEQRVAMQGLFVTRSGSVPSPMTTGLIAQQDPGPGTTVTPGTMVKVWTAAAPPVSVPGLVGLTEAQALSVLGGVGLILGSRSTAPSTGVTPGNVVSQNPPAGTMVTPGSAIDVALAAAPAQLVPVPDLTGLTRQEARRRLTTVNLRLGQVSGASGDRAVVSRQHPEAASSVEPGSSVGITLARVRLSLSADRVEVHPGQSIRFTLKSTPTIPGAVYLFLFDDGKYAGWKREAVATHRYLSPGTKTVHGGLRLLSGRMVRAAALTVTVAPWSWLLLVSGVGALVIVGAGGVFVGREIERRRIRRPPPKVELRPTWRSPLIGEIRSGLDRSPDCDLRLDPRAHLAGYRLDSEQPLARERRPE